MVSALVAACGHPARPIAPSCKRANEIGLTCVPCDAPSLMSEAARRSLALASHEAVLRGEIDSGLTKIVPSGQQWPTYFWSDTGATRFAGAEQATHLANLAAAESLVGDAIPHLIYIEIRTDGFSGNDGIVLKVSAYRRDWIPEDRVMVETDTWHIYYCVTRSGDRFTATRFLEY